ncbi:MAG: hypothetical protein Kow0047_04570 [Anaerolineae bacterium]
MPNQPNQLLILLWGGRVQPSIMLAHQLNPAAVACVVSRDTKDASRHFQTLRRVLPNAQALEPIPVNPYRVADTLAALEKIRAHYPQHQPAISVTSATVPMTIAAYETARSWKCPAYYINTSGGEILDLTTPDEPDPLHVKVPAETFVRIYGLEPVPPDKTTPYASTLSDRMAAAVEMGRSPVAHEVTAWLRGTSTMPTDGAVIGEKCKRWRGEFGAQHMAFLEILQRYGIIRDLRRTRDRVTYEIPAEGEGEFIRGEWLELYTLAAARSLKKKGVLDDCVSGLRVRSDTAEREIDLVATYRGMVMIASCKAVKKPWIKAYLDELAAVAKMLSGDYCIRLYITDQPRPAPPPGGIDPFDQFMEQARQQRIVVVTGDDLPRLAEIMRREIEKPTYAPR